MITYKTVDDFIGHLDGDKKNQVKELRRYILEEDPSIIEHIKWNAPSYMKDDEDRITFNTVNKAGVVKLVFHMGATRKEEKMGHPILQNAPLIEWASDIRGYMTFNDLQEVITNEKEIKRTIGEWMKLSLP